MSELWKVFCWVFLGMLLAAGIFSLVVCIGSAVNGIGFGEQISQWFGSAVIKPSDEMAVVSSYLKL